VCSVDHISGMDAPDCIISSSLTLCNSTISDCHKSRCCISCLNFDRLDDLDLTFDLWTLKSMTLTIAMGKLWDERFVLEFRADMGQTDKQTGRRGATLNAAPLRGGEIQT